MTCEGDFFIWGVEGGIFWQFKNIYCLTLNVWSCTAFLFWQSCNCCTIAYTQHKPDFMSLYVRWPTPGSHILRLQCVCSPCVVRKRCRNSFHTGVLQTDPWLFTTDTTFIYYFDFKSKTLLLKMLFRRCDSFLHSPVIQSFITCLKHNKYKQSQHIIQCFLLLHLLLDLYIKVLKQLAKHLNYFSYIITNILN